VYLSVTIKVMKVWIAVCLFVGAWGASGMLYEGHSLFAHKVSEVGVLCGVAGYLLFALSLFLSTRWKKLEDWIGGLDQVYQLHHRLGIWAFSFILAHPIILASKWLPHQLNRFFLFFLPIHKRFSVDLGVYAFWLMIAIIFVTVFKIISYDKWKIIHKVMSFVFVLATFHIILMQRVFGFSQWLLLIPMGIGFFGIIYRQFLFSFFVKTFKYQVVKSKPLNDNVLEVVLRAVGEPIHFIPGQYAFIHFEGANITQEQHPFTLCNERDGEISILVKVRGDFTKSLYEFLKPNYTAVLEGPYGRFDYSKAGNSQIWIAGGIGIVPFVIWAKILLESKERGIDIDFFYCTHKRIDAIYVKEFEQLRDENPNFHFHFICSEEKHRLVAQDQIAICKDLNKREILMCGPQRLTRDLKKQLMQLGVKEEKIHFEDFEFF